MSEKQDDFWKTEHMFSIEANEYHYTNLEVKRK